MKKALTLILVFIMILSFAACGTPKEPVSEQNVDENTPVEPEKVSLSLGNTNPEGDMQSLSMDEVAKRVVAATDGNFDVKCFHASALGDTDDLLEQAMQGAAIVSATDPSRLASFVPDFGILGMPYIMDDYTGLNKLVKTDLYQEWVDAFAEQKIWLLCSNWYTGVRNFTLNKIVNKPEDLKDLRIRTMGNQICSQSIEAMGAVPTPLSWSEVYNAIAQGAIEGCEVQTSAFYTSRLYEVVNTINHTEHFQLICCSATGTGFRDSLSEEYRKLLADTFYEVGDEYQEKTVDACEEWEKEMVEKHGLTVNKDVDIQAFKDATAHVYDDLGMGEVRARLQEEMAKAN